MEIKEELHKVNLGLPPDPNEKPTRFITETFEGEYKMQDNLQNKEQYCSYLKNLEFLNPKKLGEWVLKCILLDTRCFLDTVHITIDVEDNVRPLFDRALQTQINCGAIINHTVSFKTGNSLVKYVPNACDIMTSPYRRTIMRKIDFVNSKSDEQVDIVIFDRVDKSQRRICEINFYICIGKNNAIVLYDLKRTTNRKRYWIPFDELKDDEEQKLSKTLSDDEFKKLFKKNLSECFAKDTVDYIFGIFDSTFENKKKEELSDEFDKLMETLRVYIEHLVCHEAKTESGSKENILTKDLIEKLTRIYESTNSIIENGFPVDLKD